MYRWNPFTNNLEEKGDWFFGGNTLGAKKTLGSIDNQDFGIITNNTERITVLKGGNVGIGTTSPSAKLDVQTSALGYVPLVNFKGTVDPGYGATRLRLSNTVSSFLMNAYGSGAPGSLAGAASIAAELPSSKFLIGADVVGAPIQFYVDGGYATPMMTLKSGNVGIGTTNPSLAKFQIEAGNGVVGQYINGGTTIGTDLLKLRANAATQRLILEGAGGTVQTFLEAGGSIGLFGTITNHDFRIRTNYIDRMTFDTAGRVGIGTTNPLATLHVNNSSGQASLIVESTGVTAGSRADMKFASQLGDVALRFNAESSSGNNYIQSGNYAFNGNKPLYFTGYSGNQGSTVMFNFATNLFTGNVGIGTTVPDNKLHILSTTGNSNLKIETNATGYQSDMNFKTLGGVGLFQLDSAGNMVFRTSQSGLYFDALSTADMHFRTTNSYTKRMTILNGGNIGIGTTNPAYKLDVAGISASDAINTNIGYNITTVTKPTAPTYTLQSGGNIEVGEYYYFITYITAIGETNAGSNMKAVVTEGNNTVVLTIPVSTDPRVIGRKIYRTKKNLTSDNEFYLATISNNTTTTYTDTASDSTLTGVGLQFYRVNSTVKNISINGIQAMIIDDNLTTFGLNAGINLLGSYSPIRTVLIGKGAGINLTTGVSNTVVGTAFGSATTASMSTIMGDLAGYTITTGSGNTIIGSQAGRNLTTGASNVIIGINAGSRIADNVTALTTPNNSIYIGRDVKGYSNSDDNAIVIGYNAIGKGSNTAVIGNDYLTALYVSGQIVPAKLSSEPTGIEGGIYYNTTDKHFYGYNGTTYVQLDN